MLDQIDAVAFRELQINKNSGIRRRCYTPNRLVGRKRDVREKALLPQPIDKHDRRIRIIIAEQYTKVRLANGARRESDRVRPLGEIDVKNRPTAGCVVEADCAVEPIDDLLDDA